MPLARLVNHDLNEGIPDEFLKSKFDCIISSYALHHIDNPAKVKLLRSCLSLLNPGGTVIIGDIMFENDQDLNECNDEFDEWFDEDEYYLVAEEILPDLAQEWDVHFRKISYCAGILELRMKPVEAGEISD